MGSIEPSLQVSHKAGKPAKSRRPAVGQRLDLFWRSEPLAHGVSRHARALGDFIQQQLVEHMHPANFSQHFHVEPVQLCPGHLGIFEHIGPQAKAQVGIPIGGPAARHYRSVYYCSRKLA